MLGGAIAGQHQHENLGPQPKGALQTSMAVTCRDGVVLQETSRLKHEACQFLPTPSARGARIFTTARSVNKPSTCKVALPPPLVKQFTGLLLTVKELNLSYYIGETLLVTIYTHYGNFI